MVGRSLVRSEPADIETPGRVLRLEVLAPDAVIPEIEEVDADDNDAWLVVPDAVV